MITKEQFRNDIYTIASHMVILRCRQGNRRLQDLMRDYFQEFYPEVWRRALVRSRNEVHDTSRAFLNNISGDAQKIIDLLYESLTQLRNEVVGFIMDNYDVDSHDLSVRDGCGWKLEVSVRGDIILREGGTYTNGAFVFDVIEGDFDAGRTEFNEVTSPRPNLVLGKLIRC